MPSLRRTLGVGFDAEPDPYLVSGRVREVPASRLGQPCRSPQPVGADTSSTSGDLDVFVDQPTETIDPENPDIGCWSGWRDGSLRRCLAECPVGPMLVVLRYLAQQRHLQMSST